MNTNIYRGENLQKVDGYIYSYKGNKFIVRYSVKQDCWGFQPLGTKKFFKTISEVGSYFEKMGLVNNKEKKQSSYRPNKVVNIETGKTLKEDMTEISIKNFVSQEKVIHPTENISKTKVYYKEEKNTPVETEYDFKPVATYSKEDCVNHEGEYPSDRWVNKIFNYLNKNGGEWTPADLLKEALKLDYHSMSKKQISVWMYTKESLRTDSRFIVTPVPRSGKKDYELVSLA